MILLIAPASTADHFVAGNPQHSAIRRITARRIAWAHLCLCLMTIGYCLISAST
jgi:hypothetical protein